MKLLTICALLLGLTYSSNVTAQKVKEKDIEGLWMMRIEIPEENWKDEIDDEDNPLARAIIRGVSGFVDGILEDLDIRFEFMKNNEVKVTASIFGEEEVEYAEWLINGNGEIEISEIDMIDQDDDDDTVWRLEDGILVAYDRGRGRKMDDDALVYMVRLQ